MKKIENWIEFINWAKTVEQDKIKQLESSYQTIEYSLIHRYEGFSNLKIKYAGSKKYLLQVEYKELWVPLTGFFGVEYFLINGFGRIFDIQEAWRKIGIVKTNQCYSMPEIEEMVEFPFHFYDQYGPSAFQVYFLIEERTKTLTNIGKDDQIFFDNEIRYFVFYASRLLKDEYVESLLDEIIKLSDRNALPSEKFGKYNFDCIGGNEIDLVNEWEISLHFGKLIEITKLLKQKYDPEKHYVYLRSNGRPAKSSGCNRPDHERFLKLKV